LQEEFDELESASLRGRLFAYHLRESADGAGIYRHVEECAECGALSESIAETLRVFSAEPVPAVDLDVTGIGCRGT